MRVLIVGPTGRVGSLAVARAVAAGHEVVALVRDRARIDPQKRLTLVVGDLRDAARVGEAIAGVDAVIAAVGPRSNTREDEEALALGMGNIVSAMEAAGVRRLVALSGAGVDVPEDRKPAVDRIISRVVRRFARHVVGAKQREYQIFSTSGLEWTALRPPLVTDGAPRGYRLDLELRPGARVTRADVAQALIDQLADTSFMRAAPFVLPPAKPEQEEARTDRSDDRRDHRRVRPTDLPNASPRAGARREVEAGARAVGSGAGARGGVPGRPP